MADPTTFPVWLLPTRDGPLPAQVNDLASFRAALAQGFVFDTVTPIVTHMATAAPAVATISVPLSNSQQTNDNKGKNKR